MNYLAHAYLSFGHEEILVGNIISDFVKGSKQYEYPENIFKGIKLHRLIDAYTDEHAATKKAAQLFKPVTGLYAPVFVDVVYDHFLAQDERIFTENQLAGFANNTYEVLEKHAHHFPQKFAAVFPYMIQHNWLYNYRFTWGIEKSFQGIERRAKYLSNSRPAFDCFMENYQELKACYDLFIQDVKQYVLTHHE